MNAVLFRENAPDMEEKEVLSYLLQLTRNRVNSDDLAKSLLDTFGSLKNVLEAAPEALTSVPGIGEKTACVISAFLPMVRTWQRISSDQPCLISNRHELERYCKSLCSGLRNEEFWVICVNAQCRVVGTRRINQGSIAEVNAYPRKVVETALNYNAHAVFFCHNHPGGTCSPSREDIASTLLLQRALQPLDIKVLDHLIIAGDKSYSMAQNGDITFGR